MEVKKTTAKERVEIELDELETKRIGLHKFIGSDNFDKLSSEMQDLLRDQFIAMSDYAEILQKRLAIWDD